MNFLEILKLITSILPMVIAAIKAVEEAIPGSGVGEQKLAAVREILEALAEFSGENIMNEVWPVLKKVIDAIVKLFNSTGVFK